MSTQPELVLFDVLVDMHEPEDIATGYLTVRYPDQDYPEVYVMPRRTLLNLASLLGMRPDRSTRLPGMFPGEGDNATKD